MKAFFAAVLATVVLGLGAALVLRVVHRPAYQAFSTTGARVGNPGENLVGQSWNGLNAGQSAVPKQPPHG